MLLLDVTHLSLTYPCLYLYPISTFIYLTSTLSLPYLYHNSTLPLPYLYPSSTSVSLHGPPPAAAAAGTNGAHRRGASQSGGHSRGPQGGDPPGLSLCSYPPKSIPWPISKYPPPNTPKTNMHAPSSPFFLFLPIAARQFSPHRHDFFGHQNRGFRHVPTSPVLHDGELAGSVGAPPDRRHQRHDHTQQCTRCIDP